MERTRIRRRMRWQMRRRKRWNMRLRMKRRMNDERRWTWRRAFKTTISYTQVSGPAFNILTGYVWRVITIETLFCLRVLQELFRDPARPNTKYVMNGWCNIWQPHPALKGVAILEGWTTTNNKKNNLMICLMLVGIWILDYLCEARITERKETILTYFTSFTETLRLSEESWPGGKGISWSICLQNLKCKAIIFVMYSVHFSILSPCWTWKINKDVHPYS